MKVVTLEPLSSPINVHVTPPGSLGHTIRALIVASMIEDSVTITNPLFSDDTQSCMNILETLGITIEKAKHHIVVHGSIRDVPDKHYTLNIGLSGRTARMILPLLCIVPGVKTVTCKDPFKKRPIGDLVNALIEMGAEIEYGENIGHLPLKITSGSLINNHVAMNGSISSQYFSGLLLIAPLLGGANIEVIGKMSSLPFIDMTIEVMNVFGVNVQNNQYKSFTVDPNQSYTGKSITIEPDAISASYFWNIAALSKSTVRVCNLSPQSIQGDIAYADILGTMGCLVKKSDTDRWIEVTGTDTLNGITIDMNKNPDVVPSLAIVAAFAKGTTRITNIAHVKVKETDRILAPANELTKMGITCLATEDSLEIVGGLPHGARIETYHDHRIAMAFSTAGTIIGDVVILDADVVNKSFPTYWEELITMGIHIKTLTQ